MRTMDTFGFEVVGPIESARLVVDPGLTWSTYLGSGNLDEVLAVTFVSSQVVVAGRTDEATGSSFPRTHGSDAGGEAAFVTRFDPSLSGNNQLIYSTLFGGSDDDAAFGVGIYSGGTVAVCGRTKSSNFPTTSSAFQTTMPSSGNFNAFFCRLAANGSSLLYSTYYGGSNGQTFANALAVSGFQTTIVGGTYANNLPLSANAYDTNYDGGPGDAFVARLDPIQSGSSGLLYASYIGGNGSSTSNDEANTVALEGTSIFIGGLNHSSGFHTTTGAFQGTIGGAQDGFLMSIDPTQTPGAQLTYSTFLGGSADDDVRDIAVFQGVFYACGWTASSGFPTSVKASGSEEDAYQTSAAGGFPNAFVTKLDPAAATQQLRYSTLLGGSDVERAYAIERVQDRVVVLVGMTESNDFPTGDYSGSTPPDSTLGGNSDAFLTRLVWKSTRSTAQHLDYSTHLGGGTVGASVHDDEARALIMDGSTDAYIGGWTRSSTFPTAGNPFDPTFNFGTADGFATLFVLPPVSIP